MKWMGKLAGLPDDAVGRVSRVVMIGKSRVTVYNADKLKHFTNRSVHIQLTDATLEINGESLEVKELMPAEVIIEGTITLVCMKDKKSG